VLHQWIIQFTTKLWPWGTEVEWSGMDGQNQAITYVGSFILTESIDYEEIWSRVGGL
jgi:hypothetical protein